MRKTLENLTCEPMWVSHMGCLKGCKEVVDMRILPEMEVADALHVYQTSADALHEVSELFPFFGHKAEHIMDAWRREKAIDLLHRVRDAEAEGLNVLERMVNLLNSEVTAV